MSVMHTWVHNTLLPTPTAYPAWAFPYLSLTTEYGKSADKQQENHRNNLYI